MTVILEFRQQRDETSVVRAQPHKARETGSAEVIIFPGVRIDREAVPVRNGGRSDEVSAVPGAAARAGGPDSVDD